MFTEAYQALVNEYEDLIVSKYRMSSKLERDKVDEAISSEVIHFFFENMSKDYSDHGYEIHDATVFIQKYKDFYDVTKNQKSYLITQKDISKSLRPVK